MKIPPTVKELLKEMMVGYLRYQPDRLVRCGCFGYNQEYKPVAQFELAGMDTLAEIGVIPQQDYVLLTPEMREEIMAIATTKVDELERSGGGHDIRAFTILMQSILPPPLRRWAHVPFTSYDPLGTALSLKLLKSYQEVIGPDIKKVIRLFVERIREHAGTKQMGRTHLQHALCITAGFWLATILSRVIYCARKIDEAAAGLVGKASGATGSRNAQVMLGIPKLCGKTPFDERVLNKLGLKPARITTQILPPEPVVDFLFRCMELTQAFGQFGNDCRILMMPEIGEVRESAPAGTVSSSTMAGKENPRWSEANAGMAKLAKWAFQLPLDCFNSNLQRDLVDSACYRFFPLTVIFLAVQLENLLRENKQTGLPFIKGLAINPEACLKNIQLKAHANMGEALYLALQWHGYSGDAHKLVNDVIVPDSRISGSSLIDEARGRALTNSALQEALSAIPTEMMIVLQNPQNYIGDASAQALAIADEAEKYAAQ